jgi:hypothetical protein
MQDQTQATPAPVVVDFTVLEDRFDSLEHKIIGETGQEEKQPALDPNRKVAEIISTPEKAEEKHELDALAKKFNEKIAALEQKLVAKAEDEQTSLKARLAQSKTQSTTAQREADVLVSRLAALEEKLVSTIDTKLQQQPTGDIAEMKEDSSDKKEADKKEGQTALESRLAALEAKLLASHSVSNSSEDQQHKLVDPETSHSILAKQANSSEPKIPTSSKQGPGNEQVAEQPQLPPSHEQEEEEKEDWGAQEEDLLPCQRCSSYIMAAGHHPNLLNCCNCNLLYLKHFQMYMISCVMVMNQAATSIAHTYIILFV